MARDETSHKSRFTSDQYAHQLQKLKYEPVRVKIGRPRKHRLNCDRIILYEQDSFKGLVYRFVFSTFPKAIHDRLGKTHSGGSSKYRYYLYISEKQFLTIDPSLFVLRSEKFVPYYDWLRSLDK